LNKTVVQFKGRSRDGLAPGTRLNDLYEVGEALAAGGMGEVYRGIQIATGDPVAIKVMKHEFASDEAVMALFQREASALNRLHHDSIVRYYIFGTDRTINRTYLAMELVDGDALSDLITRRRLSTTEVNLLRVRIAGGLQVAHDAGIIHRDVSPDNVLLPDEDVRKAKIIDFGIARSTKSGQATVIGDGFAGKYNYVSPEQAGMFGGDVTPRSDIYSLGLLMVACLRGEPIDMGGSMADVIEKRRTVPDLTDIDPEVRPLIERMLAPDPKDRPASMVEVAAWTWTPPPPEPQPAKLRSEAPAGNAGEAAGRASARTRPARQEPGDAAPGGTGKMGAVAAGVAVLVAAGVGGYVFLGQPSPQQQATAAPPVLAPSPALAPPPVSQPSPPPPAVAVAPPPAAPTPAASPPAAPEPAISSPAFPAAALPAPALPAPAPVTPAPVIPAPVTPAPARPSEPTIASREPAQPPPAVAALPPSPPQLPIPALPPAPPAATVPPGSGFRLLAAAEQVKRITDYVRLYDGDPCLLLRPLVVTEQAARVAAFSAEQDVVDEFQADFTAVNGFAAAITAGRVAPAQCPAVSFAQQIETRPDVGVSWTVARPVVRAGERVSATLAGARSQAVAVLVIDEDGSARNLTPQIRQVGENWTLEARLDETRPAKGATKLLLGIVSSEPLPSLPSTATPAGELAALAAQLRTQRTEVTVIPSLVRYD
jgi:serine/threonine-protein kinase